MRVAWARRGGYNLDVRRNHSSFHYPIIGPGAIAIGLPFINRIDSNRGVDKDLDSTPGLFTKAVIRAAERAMNRSAVLVHEDLKRGLYGLATIASIAPLIGIFGTLLGIVNSFPGLGTDKSTALAVTTGRLSEACVPTALGLLVALQALWCYKYFANRLAVIDHELKIATLGMVNELTFRFGHPKPQSGITPVQEPLFFLNAR